MKSKHLLSRSWAAHCVWIQIFALLLFVASAFAQETTGGLQGTVKDSSGAVVPNAQVVVTSSTLIGNKTGNTDSGGYYRFANLPPGSYVLTITAKGFRTSKREGLVIEVGHLPTVDVTLDVGGTETVVEVTGATPAIDVTTNTNQTNVTSDVINDIPHGRSFQSVIQFAPMARNEPLGGFMVNGAGSGGTGGAVLGSSGSGNTFGYSVGGGSDSENSYLVEGQDTEQISGGYSKANVPFQFIQEVQIKSSGIEAEHGGALGGVVNVVMKKGSNGYHGQLFSTYESSGLDANNNSMFLRYDPAAPTPPAGFDPRSQDYNPRQDHLRIIQPGVTFGGPIMKDRLWFFVGVAPQFNSTAKTVDFGTHDGGAGKQYFTQDLQQQYTTARLDATLTQKIRVYGSWLYQYARETGVNLPISDPVNGQAGYLNQSINTPLANYSHGLGWSAPNATYNIGGDFTLTPKIVATTRYGYFFENYRDFGWQTSTPDVEWVTNGVGALDNQGNPVPAGLQQNNLTNTAPYVSTFTPFNANKHYQFDQDVAFFKSGWAGTHNIKVGYQLNHLVNVVSQNGNVPRVLLNVGQGLNHPANTLTGVANCNLLTAAYGTCSGLDGYAVVQDFATVLTVPASDWNHGFFAQDAWTIGHGLTINAGLRIEKESLPAAPGVNVPGINFSWSDKIAPRVGAAWDVMRNGKVKVFGSYGVVNDVMKLLLAQTSFGAQAFEQCTYALGPDSTGTFDPSKIDLVFKNGRACPSGPATLGANFASGATPASLIDSKTGVSLIENVNFRPAEPVSPGVKPYRQHEYVAGVDYQLGKDWALEARYDLRRLDHVIEDASLADPSVGELYTIVNPGEGVNRTLDGYANYLQSLGQAFLIPGYKFNSSGTFGSCPTCPAMPKAIRDYDGLEFRLTKSASHGWAGLFSYTWSRLWGNYTGLTTTDAIDGNATGRNSPDTSRAFDEPFYYFGANGKSTNGLLPTDRPNTLKGNVYYQLPWKGMTTSFGLFQFAYQGSPMSSFIDLTASNGAPYESAYLYGRGNWVNTTQDGTGNITLGTPFSRRTPWFTQTDFNIAHSIKVNKNNEAQVLRFEATAANLLNQHAVVAYYQGINSQNAASALFPGLIGGAPVNLASGAPLYHILESGYNPQQWINGNGGLVPRVIQSSQYGLPQQYQNLRTMRMTVSFTF
jgi:hypothetical protein